MDDGWKSKFRLAIRLLHIDTLYMLFRTQKVVLQVEPNRSTWYKIPRPPLPA